MCGGMQECTSGGSDAPAVDGRRSSTCFLASDSWALAALSALLALSTAFSSGANGLGGGGSAFTTTGGRAVLLLEGMLGEDGDTVNSQDTA